MIKSYMLHDSNNNVTQFTRCDETEIELYQSAYIEIEEDSYTFDSSKTYKVENERVVSYDRTDDAYVSMVKKSNRQVLVDSIEVTYNEVIYQGDETSQDRMSRSINGLPDDITTILWKAKDNSSHEVTRLDLKEILFLAGQEQTKIWFS